MSMRGRALLLHSVPGIRFTRALSRWLPFLLLASAALPLCGRTIRHEGRAYTAVASLAKDFGMQSYWLKGENLYRMRGSDTIVDVMPRSRLLRINSMPLYLGFPTIESKGQLYLANADLSRALRPILAPQRSGRMPNCRRIAIDAGHGGKDHGATNSAFGLSEKALSFDVARRLQQLLLAAGFEVIQTRREDRYLPLSQRPERAKQRSADLFLSLHFNAAASKTASGYETFALTPQYQASTRYSKPSANDSIRFAGNRQDPWNVLLAYHIQQELVRRMAGPDRGVKRARFKVLKELHCPGVLVEMGFMSHAPTAEKLCSAAHRQQLAQSLFDGIVAYRKRLQSIQFR